MTDLRVEDHEVGFVVLGTGSIHDAKVELADYVEDVSLYKFALPIQYEGGSAVWLTTEPGAHWVGAKDHTGAPL